MTEVVFIHGLLHGVGEYQPLIGALETLAPVVTPVAPGHDVPLGHPFSAAEWVADVTGQVESRDAVVLVGHSAGGHVATLVAAAVPDVAVGVVTLDTPLRVRRDVMTTDRAKAMLDGVARDPARRDIVHHLVDGDLDTFFEGFEEDLLESGIRSPWLIIGADPSVGSLLTDGAIAEALDRFPAARAARVTGFGHVLGVDDAQVGPLMELLTPFIEGIVEV